MTVRVFPGALSGTVGAIPSKSEAHRLLICAALADRPTKIKMPRTSSDIDATAACLEALGALVERKGDFILVTPIARRPENPLLDCAESGSTLRFLLPVAAALGDASFTGCGRLPQRPIGELLDTLSRAGAVFSSGTLPLNVSGGLKPGVFELPGNISSQYITGLLLALPLLDGDSEIKLTTKPESAGYIDITLHALSLFGVKAVRTQRGYSVEGRQKYISPGTVRVEGDWSNAAFFLSAAALGSKVSVNGLDMMSVQGDREIMNILPEFAAIPEAENGCVSVSSQGLKSAHINLEGIPDMLPALCVLSAFASGETVFTGGARLRLKESDRLSSCREMICSLGGIAHETDDGLIVRGTGLRGGTVESFNDHRIVMAAAVAATACREPVIIKSAEAVNKSYPGFFEDFAALGGKINVI